MFLKFMEKRWLRILQKIYLKISIDGNIYPDIKCTLKEQYLN